MLGLFAFPFLAQEEDGDGVNAQVFTVVTPDIEASNGVVHVIDTVLVPPSIDVAALLEGGGDESETTEQEEAEDEAPVEEGAEGDLPSIAQIVADSPDHTILLAAVEEARLLQALNGDGELTLLAPNDAAFESLLETLDVSAEELLANVDLLTAVLSYHVIPQQTLMVADLAELNTYETLLGDTIELGFGAAAVEAGRQVAGGASAAEMTEVAAEATAETTPAAEMTEAAEATAETTPAAEMTEEAAAAEATAEMTPAAEMTEEAAEPGTIVEVAAGVEDFSTLVTAIEEAGLVEALSAEGPFTVFAPTDDAFAATLEELGISAEDLLADTEMLANILTYHVVDGSFTAADVTELDGEAVDTLNGDSVEITIDDDSNVMVNGAMVVEADVMASNGIVHVIDTVLLPPEAPEAEATPEATAEPEAAAEDDDDMAAASDDQVVTLVNLIGDPAQGEEIFNMTYETNLGPWACSQCHMVESDSVGGIGPVLYGLRDITDTRNPDVAPERYIYNSILNSNGYIVEGYNENIMPQNWGEILSDDELYHLTAYIMTLGEE